MINTGIIRKIDDLGRIVLPKEIRKSLNIYSGDDLQISIDNERIILEKYSRLDSFEETIIKIINSFCILEKYKIYLTINDKIVNYNNEKITNIISNIIQSRKIYKNDKNEMNIISDNIKEKGKIVILPIVIESDLLGSIIIVGNMDINYLENILIIIENIIKKLLK